MSELISPVKHRNGYYCKESTNVWKGENEVGGKAKNALRMVGKSVGKGKDKGGGENSVRLALSKENYNNSDPSLAGGHSGNKGSQIQAEERAAYAAAKAGNQKCGAAVETGFYPQGV